MLDYAITFPLFNITHRHALLVSFPVTLAVAVGEISALSFLSASALLAWDVQPAHEPAALRPIHGLRDLLAVQYRQNTASSRNGLVLGKTL